MTASISLLLQPERIKFPVPRHGVDGAGGNDRVGEMIEAVELGRKQLLSGFRIERVENRTGRARCRSCGLAGPSARACPATRPGPARQVVGTRRSGGASL